MASFHMLDGEVPPAMILIISLLGPMYSSNFQAPLAQYQTYGVVTPRNLSIASITPLCKVLWRLTLSKTGQVENSSILDFSNTTKWFPVSRKAMIFSLNSYELVNMGKIHAG